MVKFTSVLLALLMFLMVSACARQQNLVLGMTESACNSPSEPKEYWLEIRKNADNVNGDEIAPALADCLRSPDPILRDRVAYEVLAYWLRSDKLSSPVKRGLTFRLQSWLSLQGSLASPAPDPAIGRAFSALVLSELMRADAISGFLSIEELASLSDSAAQMFASERDYRGLDPGIGWIHALAHASDLLWRLSIHPRVSGEHLNTLLGSVALQLIEAAPPPFVFNEADRIARVVAAIAARPEVQPNELKKFLDRIADPGVLSSWNKSFSSISGMAKLHNTKQLLRALREKMAEGDHVDFVALIDIHLKSLP